MQHVPYFPQKLTQNTHALVKSDDHTAVRSFITHFASFPPCPPGALRVYFVFPLTRGDLCVNLSKTSKQMQHALLHARGQQQFKVSIKVHGICFYCIEYVSKFHD